MSVFCLIPFPEEIGVDTPGTTTLQGNIFDIQGNPVVETIGVSLNVNAAEYKTDFNLDGSQIEGESSEIDGSWSLELPDSFYMSADSYYDIVINERTFRKVLPDFPAVVSLNELDDYC